MRMRLHRPGRIRFVDSRCAVCLCATVRDKGEGSVAATREPIIREKLGKTHRNNYEAGYTHENTVAT